MNPINGSLGSQTAVTFQQDPTANQSATLRDAVQIQPTASEQLVQNMGQVNQSEGGSRLNAYA